MTRQVWAESGSRVGWMMSADTHLWLRARLVVRIPRAHGQFHWTMVLGRVLRLKPDGGTSTITASLDHATYADVTVNLAYTGTATSGTDYATPSSSITIIGGTTSANATTGITGLTDSIEEGGETIIIDVSSVSGGSATESGVQQRTITLADDDDSTPPTFDVTPAKYVTGLITEKGICEASSVALKKMFR